MLNHQPELVISKYLELYDILIPKDDMLRRINEMVDFSFVISEVKDNYSEDMGRTAEDPVQIFKYLLLKDLNEMSDRDLIKRTLTDLSFKYFLNIAPEETNLIHPTTLTKFRRKRLISDSILDKLIQKTVELAIEKGIDMGTTLIVDATHTRSRYNQKSAQETLLDRARKLRKEVYRIDESIKEQFPPKIENGSLDDVIEYCRRVSKVVENLPNLTLRESISKKLNFLNEGIDDTAAALQEVGDFEATVGYKSPDDPFFGYKTHLAISENRIITAATITTGDKPDGYELQALIEKTELNGMKVEEVIGDAAYSGKDNLNYAEENEIKLIAKLHPVISNGTRIDRGFTFNKDANMMVCPAGHLATRVRKSGKKNIKINQAMTYYFDVETCKICSQKNGCYKEGAKAKTYSVSLKSELHQNQMAFEKTDYFKERHRERYMIEAKNSELKNQHGYNKATSSGLLGMNIQGAISIFTVNLKRILTLIDEKKE